MGSDVFSVYYDENIMRSIVERGGHRDVVGGMWDEIGNLQLTFLKDHGLTTASSLLDIGCGSLRLGARAVDYLAPGQYWGTDISLALLEAGYEREIVHAGLSHKLPRSHLVTNSDFNFSGLPNEFDFAVAQSVFTHLPLNHMRLCLANLGHHLTSRCTFFFTVFTPPSGRALTESHEQLKGGVITHPDRDPFHYSLDDIYHAARETAWSIQFIGDWDHPRNQMMVKASKP